MTTVRSLIALMCCLLTVAPQCLPGQTASLTGPARGPANDYPDEPQTPRGQGKWIPFLTNQFSRPDIPPVNMQNSDRLEQMMRAGNLYLSLQDAIALALENNLDIELSRYGPQIAHADYLRAKAGGLLRGVPTAVQEGPESAATQAAGGETGQRGGGATFTGTGSGGTGGTIITQTGVAVPNLDPSFYSSFSAGHTSSPQTNTVTTGTNALIFDSRSLNMGIQKAWVTGTSVSLGWNNDWVRTNNRRSELNPFRQGNIRLTISQRLLQGFGLAVNRRNIQIARNGLKVADLVFQQQVMTTVASVANLYWDLVSFIENARVRRQALDVAQKFYEDNKKQVEIGTLAPIEIVRAEARVAQAQTDLTAAETSVLQQETILKSALSRNGIASPTLARARIIPTDTLPAPGDEKLPQVEELVQLALERRPDLEQTRLNLENSRIGMAGSRSQLLPSLDLQAAFANKGLAGSPNDLNPLGVVLDPFLAGGWGNVQQQILRRNFPDYSIAFQLSFPIRNRQAQSDYIRDQLQLRQSEINQQRQLNNIRVAVQNAVIAVQQAAARYQSAMKERILQEQTLDAEQKKYALGASTAFLVIQTQRDLAQAQGNEVAALAAYNRARVQLDLATAVILDRFNVKIEEAKAGRVSRPASAPPAAPMAEAIELNPQLLKQLGL